MTHYVLDQIARLPVSGDNVAIAVQRIAAGTEVSYAGRRFVLPTTVMEGHRFAVAPIAPGEWLLSWGLPFGTAVAPIAPGDYVCNASILEALSTRNLDFALPEAPNFVDSSIDYVLDEAGFQPATQVPLYAEPRTFMGYRRGRGRGVGTRNFVVLLGTTSRTGSFVRQLEQRLKGAAEAYPNIDGIVAVAHTEGGSGHPNNTELVLRTLAGWMINPNVGAVLAVDYGIEPISNRMVQAYLEEHGYPIDDLPHAFMSLTDTFQANLGRAEEIVRGWLPEVNQTARTPESLAHLKLALQCGGSDAFSGISANPLLGWVTREVVQNGGAGNLAETDELIGAETYVLDKVRDLETARTFLAMIARFKERVAWHGHTAEGNPSGGNKYRGLYNIILKSIGAANKKDPAVRLDYAIEYGELMREPGYYFMDSPGNDLESVAGQMASGCNLIFFTTGNGSVTNFPFVPTIKIVTTTRRYNLLARDMDINAGAYLDGVSMDEVGKDAFELTVRVASGERSAGERAGHSQAQIWRDWPQTDGSHLEELLHQPAPAGASLPIRAPKPETVDDLRFAVYRTDDGTALDRVGLILPTSLCAGQVAQMTAARLNRSGVGRDHNISRYVSLVHTEGCGNSAGSSEELYVRTILGYLQHPLVSECLLMEHGCEKTHNDYMRAQMAEMGIDPGKLGWASIQLDGGIDSVMHKAEDWFTLAASRSPVAAAGSGGLEVLRLGLASAGPVSPAAARAFAQVSALVVAAGGTVVVPQNAGVLSDRGYLDATLGNQPAIPTLAYGERMQTTGFHVMETPTEHWVETLTGLCATGVETVVVYVSEHPVQTHPLVPLLQASDNVTLAAHYGPDLDIWMEGDEAAWPRTILARIAEVAAHQYAPKLYQLGNVDFQITRGLLGVSM